MQVSEIERISLVHDNRSLLRVYQARRDVSFTGRAIKIDLHDGNESLARRITGR